MKLRMKKNRKFVYKFANGESVTLKAILPSEYRLISTSQEYMIEEPEVPLDVYQDRHGEWQEVDWLTKEEYELALGDYEKYENQLKIFHHHKTLQYIINNGIVDSPSEEEVDDILSLDVDMEKDQVKVEWVWDKCSSQEEFFDLVDAILGINMPTESGVRQVLDGFQSMIMDNGEIVPLTEWESRRDTKGGFILPLWAEGLLSCKELNGIITLKEYFGMVGDPRYIDDNSEIPMSMSGVIALNRMQAKSGNATKEIDMEKSDKDIGYNPEGKERQSDKTRARLEKYKHEDDGRL